MATKCPVLLRALQQGGGIDYTKYALLTQPAIEELAWWQEHLTKWNGRCFLSREPDIVIETDALTTARLGSSMQWGQNRGTLVTNRKKEAHQLPGAASSSMLCQRQNQHFYPSQDGQPNNSPHVYKGTVS